MSERPAKAVVEELFRRGPAAWFTMSAATRSPRAVSSPACPRRILRTIDDDLGPVTVEQHHLIGDGDLVAQHLTLHGTHRASTMPLLAGSPPSGRPTAWTFIHIWRVEDGRIVEHWACRDDMGLLEQVRR